MSLQVCHSSNRRSFVRHACSSPIPSERKPISALYVQRRTSAGANFLRIFINHFPLRAISSLNHCMLQRYAQFADLPLELLPAIIQHVVKPSHLAAVCLVDHRFYEFAIPLLYERVFIYAWHKEGKAKVSDSLRAKGGQSCKRSTRLLNSSGRWRSTLISPSTCCNSVRNSLLSLPALWDASVLG